MRRIIANKNRFFYSYKATIMATVNFVIALVLFLIGMSVYPSYDNLRFLLSKLGTRWPSSLFFDLGLIMAIIGIIILYIQLTNSLKVIFTNEKDRIVQLLFLPYSLLIISIIGIIIFPAAGQTLNIHNFFAFLLFSCLGIISSWISYRLLFISHWNKKISFLGFICALAVVILAILLDIWQYAPLVQKITIGLFAIWQPLNNYYLMNLVRKKL